VTSAIFPLGFPDNLIPSSLVAKVSYGRVRLFWV
jgi:hypothetical protein